MRLQTNLHLPTRQRLDGHHEMPHSKFSQKYCRFIQRAFLIALPIAGVLAPRAAHADAKPVGVWGWTTGNATYVRIRPGQQTPIVAKVPRRTQLMVWGTFSGWYRVETTDHKFGWIYHQYANVPKAEKLHELSHFKAKKASDNAGRQVLYGDAATLKKYYAHYKAPGAKRGLAKQGVVLVSNSHSAASAPQKSIKIAARPVVARTVANKHTTKHTVAKTARPHAPAVKYAPRVVTVPSAPDTSTPVAPGVATSPSINTPSRPVVASAPRKIIRKTVVRKTVTKTVRAPHIAQPTGQLPRITAEEIMRARREHLRSQPSFRHKTRPTQAPQQSTPITENAATIEPTSYQKASTRAATPRDLHLNWNADNSSQTNSSQPVAATAKTTAAKTVTTKTVTTKQINRGGSPRDYARWAQANNKFGDGMAQQALSYRGMPYISGAANPKRGFDCSGLVYYLLRTRGFNPPRTASEMTSMGKSVSRGQLKPGDIVFFANTYKRGVSHVGVYIGNGNFVHAPHSGSRVQTESLNSSYYSKKYWGARRIK